MDERQEHCEHVGVRVLTSALQESMPAAAALPGMVHGESEFEGRTDDHSPTEGAVMAASGCP
jgi:hypothetical protein